LQCDRVIVLIHPRYILLTYLTAVVTRQVKRIRDNEKVIIPDGNIKFVVNGRKRAGTDDRRDVVGVATDR